MFRRRGNRLEWRARSRAGDVRVARQEHDYDDYTPQQIHAIGLKEVERIQAQMVEIRKELNFSGTSAEFIDQVLKRAQVPVP